MMIIIIMEFDFLGPWGKGGRGGWLWPWFLVLVLIDGCRDGVGEARLLIQWRGHYRTMA